VEKKAIHADVCIVNVLLLLLFCFVSKKRIQLMAKKNQLCSFVFCFIQGLRLVLVV